MQTLEADFLAKTSTGHSVLVLCCVLDALALVLAHAAEEFRHLVESPDILLRTLLFFVIIKHGLVVGVAHLPLLTKSSGLRLTRERLSREAGHFPLSLLSEVRLREIPIHLLKILEYLSALWVTLEEHLEVVLTVQEGIGELGSRFNWLGACINKHLLHVRSYCSSMGF